MVGMQVLCNTALNNYSCRCVCYKVVGVKWDGFLLLSDRREGGPFGVQDQASQGSVSPKKLLWICKKKESVKFGKLQTTYLEKYQGRQDIIPWKIYEKKIICTYVVSIYLQEKKSLVFTSFFAPWFIRPQIFIFIVCIHPPPFACVFDSKALPAIPCYYFLWAGVFHLCPDLGHCVITREPLSGLVLTTISVNRQLSK